MAAPSGPADGSGVRGTPEELQARAVDLARQGAMPIETVVEAAQSAEPSSEVLERIIGQRSERRPANWAARAARATATVCRLSVRDGKRMSVVGTGFLVSPQLILTTQHVLPDPDTARSAVAEFSLDADRSGGPPSSYALGPDRLFVTSDELDYTLVAVEGRPGDTFGWNPLSARLGKILAGEQVNLVGHPGGGRKEVQTSGSHLLDVEGDVLRYTAETLRGSAGSPVFNDQWEVIGVHVGSDPAAIREPDAEPVAVGTRISRILAQLATQQATQLAGLPARSLVAEMGPESGLAPRANRAAPAGPARRRRAPAPAAVADLTGWIGELVGDNPLVAGLVAAAREHPEDYPDAESVRRGLADLVARYYAGLAPDAARLLRRVSLLEDDDDGVEPRIAAYLTGTDVPAAAATLGELAAAGLLVERPDGRLYFVHDNVRAYAREQFEQAEVPEEQDAARRVVRRWRAGRQEPDPRLVRDFWTTDDELDHAPYAQAIASFIQHRQTRPPLTIGIKAPWGAGKTSLMRMVQKRLDPGVGETPLGPAAAGPRLARDIRMTDSSRQRVDRRRWWSPLTRPLRRRAEPAGSAQSVQPAQSAADAPVRVAEALRWSDEGGTRPRAVRATLAEEAPGLPLDDWRATVWFNPWMYQSGEQVWAGLAHEIITQITERLRVGDRERFWLRLNLARLDREALRRRTYRAIALRVLPYLVVAVVAAVVAVAALALAQLTGLSWLRGAAAGVLTLGTGVATVGGTVRAVGFLGQAAAGPFAGLVSGPDVLNRGRGAVAAELEGAFDTVLPDPAYGSRVGFLYLVQTDIKRVLDLVATEDRPVVVFIDDLDRCTPGTVAQVMEAVNLFLAGEFPHCVFVVAMEPAVVAAHIEVAYRDLVEVLESQAVADGSSIGWRFLEKIVQLPLGLPEARRAGVLDNYARGLLGLGRETPPGPRDAASVTAAAGGATADDRPAEPAPDRPSAPPRTGTAGVRLSGGDPVPARRADPDPALVRLLADRIRARRPTVGGLSAVALEVQAETVPQAPAGAPLAETAAAIDLVFRDIYRDEDAADALRSALPGLGGTTPREIKRYVNLYRFYTFLLRGQRRDGEDPAPEQVAKLAALAIRWPRLLASLGEPGPDGEHPLAALERASRADRDAANGQGWTGALVRHGSVRLASDGSVPAWYADVRTLLAAEPGIGELAARLL